MISETLKKINALISTAKNLTDIQKQELENLLSQLKKELNLIPDTQSESAQSIASFAEVATREALRSTAQKDLLNLSQDGLDKSVREFATSHPNLIAIVKTLTRTLSNLGV